MIIKQCVCGVLCRLVNTMRSSAVLWNLYAIVVVGLFSICIPVGDALRIKHLEVPTVIENGTQSSVILDCDYILEKPAEGLVVKWFFNDQPNPVYQWIPNKKPQDLGVLKGKLNLDYRASDDASKMHRALQIINPTTDLSGEYRCVVSTFEDEATEAKKMIIFVPQKSMELTQVKSKVDQVTLKCRAEGIYPEPNMTILSKERYELALAEVETISKDGLYDIEASLTIDEKDLKSPATFECILRIPETNYTVKKSTVYYTASRPSTTSTTTSKPTTTTIIASDSLSSYRTGERSHSWRSTSQLHNGHLDRTLISSDGEKGSSNWHQPFMLFTIICTSLTIWL